MGLIEWSSIRDKPDLAVQTDTCVGYFMETLEFIIYPDGRVQETVTGVIGASCAEVTALIEAQLGQVTSMQTTSDYFSASHSAQNVSETAAQVSFSQW